jgi:quinolinate synthase
LLHSTGYPLKPIGRFTSAPSSVIIVITLWREQEMPKATNTLVRQNPVGLGLPRTQLRLQGALSEEYTSASQSELAERIGKAKTQLAKDVLILGHHYQRDEVLRWADVTGDSFGLSRIAASRDAGQIVFCGVHFMAESADILTSDSQRIFLPDLNAGCSMADMADIDSVNDAWDELSTVTNTARVMPITYMNSSAAIKAFVGEAGGPVCTSSNAPAVLRWGLDGPFPRADKVLFVPDQHLGRNTGYQLGYSADDMVVWDPRFPLGGNTPDAIQSATLILWRGHCSVHQRFTKAHIEAFRTSYPTGIVLVHPECSHEVVSSADMVGSTDYIIKAVDSASPGSTIGIGTEIHLVSRLAKQNPDKEIVSLDPVICPCSTMSRIDPPHLCWILESLVSNNSPNQITVPDQVADSARIALERMLSIT